MGMTACRECGRDVSDAAPTCPHCGAPKPWNPHWDGSGYEYRSDLALWGLPVLHVAIGRDRNRRRRVARGIIAIGQYAVGLIAVGQFAFGIATLGQFTIGVWCLAQFAIGGCVVAQFGIGAMVVAQFGVAAIEGFGMRVLVLREVLGFQ